MKANPLLSLVVFALLACGPNPFNPPPCGIWHLDATLNSATLADDCPAAKTSAFSDAAPCAPGVVCQSLCRQSSMQLSFNSLGTSSETVTIVAVRLVDPQTGNVVSHLTSREPQQWSGNQYIEWDEKVPAGLALKVTYKLSAPTYGATGVGRFAGPQTYRVEVDVSVNGVISTLQVDAQREPEIVT